MGVHIIAITFITREIVSNFTQKCYICIYIQCIDAFNTLHIALLDDLGHKFASNNFERSY
jgi:hypothetical protein